MKSCIKFFSTFFINSLVRNFECNVSLLRSLLYKKEKFVLSKLTESTARLIRSHNHYVDNGNAVYLLF